MDSLNFKYYEDLKKLYKNVISKKDDKEILDYIEDNLATDISFKKEDGVIVKIAETFAPSMNAIRFY